ncbi:MAG: TraR/DksA family transcriptional regulator [Patescibacteria group bacterium]|nr:TraR/DksA family transcriptional regulator [Patescibacteria group bacterium]
MKKNKKEKTAGFVFPSNVLKPVKNFLTQKLTQLKKTKKSISKRDPFLDQSRLTDNASIDDDAAEQYGHVVTTSIKSELDKRIIQVKKALSMIKLGKYGICEDCGKMIDTDRLMIEPEATMCAKCAKKRE